MWCLQFVFRSTNSSWDLFPTNLPDYFQARDLVGKPGDEDYLKETVTIASPRYQSVKIRTTEKYHLAQVSNSGPTTGGTMVQIFEYPNASGPGKNTFETKAPPDIPRDTVIGTFKQTFKSGSSNNQILEDFSVRENSQSQLIFNGPDKQYAIKLAASASAITLNKKTNLLEDVQIPCASISVASKSLDNNCEVTLVVQGPYTTVNVTPKTSATYYRYAVSRTNEPTIVTEPSTDNLHPLVVSLRDEVRALQDQLATLKASVTSGNGASPALQQRASELRNRAQGLNTQAGNLRNHLAAPPASTSGKTN